MDLFETGDGNQVAYEFRGPREAPGIIIFLNSSILNHHQWDLLASRLGTATTSQSRLLFLEYRGFGPANPLQGPLCTRDLSSDVVHLLNENGLSTPVVLVGASLGTIVGSNIVKEHPSRVRGMIAWGFVPLVEVVLQHVGTIFNELRSRLLEARFFEEHRDERLGPENIAPFSRVMWGVFVEHHSITTNAAKARGPSSAYSRYLLRHVAGTHVGTLESFVNLGASITSPVLACGGSELDMQRKILAFHGTADLVSPFELVFHHCKENGIPFHALEGKGHADHVIDRGTCDTLARALDGLVRTG